MIDEVYSTVLSMVDKDINGYLTPAEFNLYSKKAQTEVFTNIMFQYKQEVAKRNARVNNSGYGDIAKRLEEVIGRFVTQSVLTYNGTTLRYELPSDCYWNESVMYNDAVVLEQVTYNKAVEMNTLLDASPTTDYPIFCYVGEPSLINTGQPYQIKVYPTSIATTGLITSNYIRLPKDPKWTYQGLSGGEPVFNQGAADYQDFELPEDYFDELVNKILTYAGLELRDQAVVSVSAGMEANNTQKEQ